MIHFSLFHISLSEELRKVCLWLTGNLDSVGKFRIASHFPPKDLVANYYDYYINNVECQKELEEALSRLTCKKLTQPVVEKLLFKGTPMIGKTRAVYEKVIKKLQDFIVFAPSSVELGKFRCSELQPMPGKRGLILFLDDIDEFIISPTIDLRFFVSRLESACHRLLVVATLRTGVEMTDKVIAERHGRDLLQDFLEIDFRDITEHEANELYEVAKKFGRVQRGFDGKTPGSVILGLGEMRHRLENLGTNERAVSKALKLLYSAFLPVPEKELVKAVSDGVFDTNFQNQRINWDDCIKELRDNDLLKDLGTAVTAPHSDYYRHVYDPDYTPTEDLCRLEGIFAGRRDAFSLFSLGNSLVVQHGKYEEAIKSYDRAIEIDPKKTEAWYNRGDSLGKLGRHEEAIKSYDRAIEIEPKDAKAWYNRGYSLGELGRNEEAIKSYDRAIAIDQKKAAAWYHKGVCLNKIGRVQEAEECLRRLWRD